MALRLCVLLLCLLWIDPTQANSLALQRQTFRITDAALKQGNTLLFSTLKNRLEDYPLYPYLLYQDLKQRLDQNPNAEVQRFLQNHSELPITNRLRVLWLKQLAQEERWNDFIRDYRGKADTATDCRYRQALLHSERASEALTDIDQLWMSATSLPKACDPLFQHWQKQGGLNAAQIWQRFGLAMAAGQIRLARYLQGRLSGREQNLAGLWIAVHKKPALILEAEQFTPTHPRHSNILIHGLKRWSNRDSVTALAALDTLKNRYKLPPNQLAPVERQLALYIASRNHPEALARLMALPPQQIDTPVQEWRVRTHLRQGDWKGVLKWLEHIDKPNRTRPRWQYWQARALEASGRKAEALPLYQELAKQRDYHGFLAADRLGLPYQIESTPSKPFSPHQLIQKQPGLVRARELFLLRRYGEAHAEWRLAIAALSTEEIRQTAKLAHSWGWYNQAITTLARHNDWDDLQLRFPLPHQEQVLNNARINHLDPAWIYGLMRQESLFQADAQSPAGALGLMQIMPATGRHIAQDLQQSAPSQQELLDTATNIRYGTYYLRSILDQLEDHPLLATAAYNAGPHRTQKWLPTDPMDADVWAETIPFFETRKYVQRVLEYTAIFQWRLRQNLRGLSAYMKPVLPTPTTETY